jgi:gluconokinase
MTERRIVVMGVSGSGKSTVGRLLAERLDVPFVEGDELHPPRNVALMAAGTPLTDDDRAGWLQAIAARLQEAHAQGRGLVVACSALKRRYRDVLRSGAPDTVFVLLHGDRKLLAERLQQRKGHYMPASLLQSQLETLEPPQADERAFTFDIAAEPAQIVAAVLQRLAS